LLNRGSTRRAKSDAPDRIHPRAARFIAVKFDT